MNTSFIELSIRKGDTIRRLVRPAGADIFLAANSSDDVLVDDLQVPPQARFTWVDNAELSLEPLGSGSLIQLEGRPLARRTAIEPGQRITLENATVTWRWLSLEEQPTVASDRRAHAALLSKSMAALAAELGDARYQRGEEVGRGGMGKVLHAVEAPLRRPVALKVLRDHGGDEDHDRFIREARITGQLEHPSIVPVHELGIDPTGQPFYTMKLVKGVTLLQILQDLASQKSDAILRYPLASLLTIFQKVCDAVAFAHAQPEPIIHRDLKPENIMVGGYGEVLVMDWGAAKILPHDEKTGELEKGHTLQSVNTAEPLVTQPGHIMGTPGYMAPEQARGEAALADERTDIYALGAILYTLLTLKTPRRLTAGEAAKSAESAEQGKAIIDQSLPPQTRKLLPESLGAVVRKAMSFDPKDRYGGVKALQDDVAAYQSGRATAAEEAGAWKHLKLLLARNRILFSAIAAVMATLVAATLVSYYQRQAVQRSNRALELTLHRASEADHETAHQRFRVGAWREGLALLSRSLSVWPENRKAANYLLSAIAFGHGDGDKLPILGVYHDEQIAWGVISSNGNQFATASHDGTARIWDLAAGAPIGKPMRHSGEVLCVAFSPDDRKLLTTDHKGTARLWDARTGEPLTDPLLHGKPELDTEAGIDSGIFSPDGRYIVTSSYDHTTRVWNTETGEQVAEMRNRQRASSLMYSPDGSRLLTACWRGAQLWDARTFQPIGEFMNHGTTVRNAMFSRDGNKIVSGDLKKKIRIWDGHSGQPLIPFVNLPEPIWDIDVSPDGKLFATAGWDKTARVWALDDGSPMSAPLVHEAPVDSAIFSPDGKRLLTSSRDKTVRLWDIATGKQLGNSMRHDESVIRAIFSPDGTKILSVGADKAAYLWNAVSPAWPGQLIPVAGEVCSIEFDQNDDHVLLATRDGLAGLWSLSGEQFVTPVIRQDDKITHAAFYSPGKLIATVGETGVVRFWDVTSGKEIGETAPAADPISALEFANDGKSIFTGHHHGTVSQWKIPEGTPVGETIRLSENISAFAVAPHTAEIVTAAGDDLFQFWETTSHKPCRKDIRHSTSANSLSYHPHGRFISAGGEDHTARIWSLDTGQQQGNPIYLGGRATSVRYTDDGRILVVGSEEDTEVNCYDAETHHSLCLPLSHPTGVKHIAPNTNGSLMITVTNDGVARLWRIPTTSEPPPAWLSDYLRAVGGLVFTNEQQLVQVPTRERLVLRRKLLDQGSDDSLWDKIMRESFR